MGRGIDQHRITIECGAGDFAHADQPGSAGAVFHHHLPAFLFGDLARHQPSQNVAWPARRKGDDETDRRGWEGALRADNAGRHQPGCEKPSTG